MSEEIWDRCEVLSDSVNKRYWRSDRTETVLSIDTSVKTPLGTGSIKVVQPDAPGAWNLYIYERFIPDASTMLDFNLKRPKSVFVYSEKALTFTVQIITREPDGIVWNSRDVAIAGVGANTMTEIPLVYTGITSDALAMVAQVNIIARINQVSATFYISGITSETGVVVPPPSQLPTGPYSTSPLHTEGKYIVDADGRRVMLRGIGMIHTHDDPTFWIETRSVWNPQDISNRFQWLRNEGINFVKIMVNADWILQSPNVPWEGKTEDYLGHIEDFLQIADSWGIYIEVCFNWLLNGFDQYTQGYEKSSTPYSPYIVATDAVVIPDTATFNQAVSKLAAALVRHRNALLGIWNEPSYATGQRAQYDNYFTNLPISMTAARNAGFGGIIVIMGGLGFVGGRDFNPDTRNDWLNDDMTWAILHLSLFKNYGSVIADFHAYHYWLNQYGYFPDDYNALKAQWLESGRINEARGLGIPITYFEGGIASDGDISRQNAAYANAFAILNEQGISYLGWNYSSTDQFAMLSSMIPPSWNSSGQVLINAIKAGLPPPPISLPKLALVSGGITSAVVVGYIVTRKRR